MVGLFVNDDLRRMWSWLDIYLEGLQKTTNSIRIVSFQVKIRTHDFLQTHQYHRVVSHRCMGGCV